MSASRQIPAVCTNAAFYHKQNITGETVTVAVLDSGIAPHPELQRQRILVFHDFVNQQVEPYDDYAHGTHVAGIIGASKIGIAPKSRFVILKVLDRSGNGSVEDFITAIRWILANRDAYRIRIANLSVGGGQSLSPVKQELLNFWVSRLWDAGIIVVCSAGNNGPKHNTITAPGNCPEVITVGSCDGGFFSSAGFNTPRISKPELSAPGVHILSLNSGGGYHIKNGTSMSAPFISGFVALLLQQKPYLSNDAVKCALLDAAVPLPGVSPAVQGAGVVSLQRLLLT